MTDEIETIFRFEEVQGLLEGAELSGVVQRPELNAVVAALELDPMQTEALLCETGAARHRTRRTAGA